MNFSAYLFMDVAKVQSLICDMYMTKLPLKHRYVQLEVKYGSRAYSVHI